ncbi:MAG: glycosyltransferase family 39 protein [bacterium]|nr:glycosyltransferase family 39 protein [bacterium]
MSNYLLLILLLLVFLFIGFNNILKIPPIWPDEALMADTALNILNHHPAGTELLKNTLPGAQEFGFGYPPLFFYLLAIWFKLFGFSIFAQRTLTIVISIIFLLVFYTFIKLLQKQKAAFLALSLILSDYAFLKASLISRPEIVILLLGTISTYIFLKSDKLTSKKSLLAYSLTGLLTGLGFLFHYLAIIFMAAFILFLIMRYKLKLFKQYNFLILTLSFLLPIIIWLMVIHNQLMYLINDLTLRWQYGNNEIIWLLSVFRDNGISLKIIYLIYFFIWWEIINLAFKTRKAEIKLVTLILSLSWIFSYFWHTEYAFITVIIFSYIAFITLIYESFNIKKIIYLTAFIVLISLNVYNLSKNILSVTGEKYSYSRFIDNILVNIPEGKTVYLSSIPDAYFAFKPNRNNKLYEFPFLPTTKQELTKVLNDSDYIIYNSSLEALVTENIVLEYIQKNSEQTIKIGGPDQYSAFVVKLVPKNLRIDM